MKQETKQAFNAGEMSSRTETLTFFVPRPFRGSAPLYTTLVVSSAFFFRLFQIL